MVAAALVSENKVLAHPASVDSIPTSAGQEDHVSMGNGAGLKAFQVVANAERVLAIELLSGAQAVEFLAKANGVRKDGVAKGRPSLETAAHMCEAILALSGTTNGAVSVAPRPVSIGTR